MITYCAYLSKTVAESVVRTHLLLAKIRGVRGPMSAGYEMKIGDRAQNLRRRPHCEMGASVVREEILDTGVYNKQQSEWVQQAVDDPESWVL